MDESPFASVPSDLEAVRAVAARICKKSGEHLSEAHPDAIALFADAKRMSLGLPASDAEPLRFAGSLLELEHALRAIATSKGHAPHLPPLSETLLRRLRLTASELEPRASPRGP